ARPGSRGRPRARGLPDRRRSGRVRAGARAGRGRRLRVAWPSLHGGAHRGPAGGGAQGRASGGVAGALRSAAGRRTRLARVWRAAARRRSPRSGSSGGAGASYLAKWALIGLAVGVVAGLGAALFHLALDEATRLLLVGVGGHQPPLPPGEGGTPASEGRPHLLLPLVVAGGALVSGLLVARFAPEAGGAGTDAALEAVHARAGKLRRRVPLVKVVASALTVGSGGSAGREGPASLVSAGLASAVADWLGLSAQDRRVAVTAGMGAGIGAIFSAPLGGALMAAEVLYQDDMETEAIVPSMIASIVAYSVFGAFHGFAPLFGAQTGVGIDSPLQLPYYALLGLACGAMGALYAAVFSRARGVFARLDLPAWLRPAVGGLGVGLMGLALPQVLHTGY